MVVGGPAVAVRQRERVRAVQDAGFHGGVAAPGGGEGVAGQGIAARWDPVVACDVDGR